MTVSTLKKWLALICSIIMILCSFPVTAFAQTENEITLTLDSYASTRIDATQYMGLKDNNDSALVESIKTQLENLDEYIDISEFGLLNTEENQQKIINILSYEIPECFHIAQNFGISTNRYIVGITPTYLYTKEEYDTMLSECYAAIDRMLKGVEGNSNLTDVEKLLILHDRIALHCEYDGERYELGTLPLISHSMYGVFVNKLAVCQGYALAYAYLLDRIGIKNYYCASDVLCHAWNIVYVNNKPYHVDITWDDPSWDITGKVTHENFLVSTKKLIYNGHYEENKDGSPVCDEEGNILIDYDDSPKDTTYDDYFWQDSETAFTLLNDEIYYIDGKEGQTVSIKRYSDKQAVYTTTHYWQVSANVYLPGNYARLDTDGKDLLFSLSDAIYKLDVKTGKATAIHTPTLYYPYRIYGFTHDDNMLIYDLCDYYYFGADTKKLYEHKVEYLTYTPGDIDDNSAVNLVDVSVIAQVMAGWSVKYNKLTLDVNGDGYENLKDLVHLARYVAGWQGIELH